VLCLTAWLLSSCCQAVCRPASSDDGATEDDFRKKESAHEREYATRQERQTLMDMLAKMERDADPGDVKAKKALELIFSSNGVKTQPKLVQDLLKCQHHSKAAAAPPPLTVNTRSSLHSHCLLCFCREAHHFQVSRTAARQ
jgi:hypothetical protein